jgi:hypothetical protein
MTDTAPARPMLSPVTEDRDSGVLIESAPSGQLALRPSRNTGTRHHETPASCKGRGPDT